MTIIDITKQKQEELRSIDVTELNLSVLASNCLLRNGYKTVEDLLFSTMEELKSLKKMTPKLLDEILDRLAEKNIYLLTEEEKQKSIESEKGKDILKGIIRRLEYQKGETEKYADYLREELNKIYEDKQQKEKKKRESAMQDALQVVKHGMYPVADVIKEMYFGGGRQDGVSFCKIFGLDKETCIEDNDCVVGRYNIDSCGECIDNYLAEHYWKFYAEKSNEGEKLREVVGKRRLGMTIIGKCPKCRKRVSKNENEKMCPRCGYGLNWDGDIMESEYSKRSDNSWEEDESIAEKSKDRCIIEKKKD